MNGETENKLKKVLLICGSSQTVINFRLGLIKTFQDKGWVVSVVALDDDYKAEIEKRDVTFYSVCTQNRSLNPFGMKKMQKQYVSIIEKERPDTVFTFMLKPNIFGVRAAKKIGINKIYSMVEGGGDVFINNGFKWKIIRFAVCKMYRKSFRYAQKVFFLNNDDKSEFLQRKLVEEKQCIVIPGIGVDLNHFAYKPITNHNTFLMIARMLKTKGIIEYCKAARIVKQKYPDAVFNYLGAEGNIKISDIQEYIDDGSINYLGTTKDVRPYLEECAVYVLPSYREGMPVSIMEAEATGRAIIASNTNGCRDTVIEGYNGFFIACGDFNSLAQKMIWCFNNPEEVVRLGKSSRDLAEQRFDNKVINGKLVEIID